MKRATKREMMAIEDLAAAKTYTRVTPPQTKKNIIKEKVEEKEGRGRS